MDIEGHERYVLPKTTAKLWEKTDAIVEIENTENANIVYQHFGKMNSVNLFSQKNNWDTVEKLEDMPTSYKEGSLFISSKSKMPWV